MFNLSKSLAAAASFLSALTLANTLGVKTIDGSVNPSEALSEYEFSVISFYVPSDPQSVEIDALMEGAKLHMDKMVAEGVWTERDIGWFRINIEEDFEMSYDESGEPDQMISGHGWRRMIGFRNDQPTQKENEEIFAKIVRELTGDFIQPIKCENIQKERRVFFDEVVYFGPGEDVQVGGVAEIVRELSILDRFNFNEQKVAFWYNDDNECREEWRLGPDEKTLGILNGEALPNMIPLEKLKDEMTIEKLIFELNTSIVKGTPRWGQRAFSAFFDLKQNGIIYYLPQGTTAEVMQKDWRVTMMVQIQNWIFINKSTFIPIVWSWASDDSPALQVPPLRKYLSIEEDDLPMIYAFHGLSGAVFKYPDQLVTPDEITPDLVLLWAQKSFLTYEIETLGNRLERSQQEGVEEEKKLDEETKQSIEEHIEKSKSELAQFEEAIAEIRNEFAEKGNMFKHYLGSIHPELSSETNREVQEPQEEVIEESRPMVDGEILEEL